MINGGNDANGVPQFTTATHYFSPFADARSLTVGDLNGDGNPDFIIGGAYGQLQVYLNNGVGAFTTGQATAVQPNVGGAVGAGVIADVNGDGKADFIVTDNQAGATDIFFGNGDGTFQAPVVIANYAVSVAVADLNKDSKPDLVEGYVDGTVTVSLNNGNGTFSSPMTYSTVAGGAVSAIALADMNGDGNLDLVANNYNSNNGVNGAAVLVGNGDGTFGAPNFYTVNHTPVNLSVDDFNGDGEPDIGTVGFNDDTYGVLLNTTVFPPPPINWVNWTGTETDNGVTKYVGQMVVPRTSGGSTTVNVKYTPPTQQVAELGFVGIAFAQYSSTQSGNYIHDYWRQGSGGSLGRNPARSPYTSPKVPNIPDGGGAANDQWDLIALRYAGVNTLEFTDASTGFPISIASPIFAYVSLNGNGYGFDQDFDILSFGDGIVRDTGYFGAGTSFKSVATVNGAPQYQLLGTGEPHGALQFRGAFSTVTWQSLSSEFWNGFTIGVAQLAEDVPIANAGPDQTVSATSSNGATVQLNGSVSGSTKTPFTFTWSGDFGTASGQNPTVTLPIGTHTITLTVTDAANASDSDEVVVTVDDVPIDNVPPVLSLPNAIVTEATSPAGATVNFSVSANDAIDGPVPVALRVLGNDVGPNPSPFNFSGAFPLGIRSVTASATDQAGNVASGSFTITVQDTTPPFIASLTASPAILWSPNHKMVPVTITPAATDAVGVTSLRILSVTSNEPDNGLGDGDMPNDIVFTTDPIAVNGPAVTGQLTLQLRAERSGAGNGRVYTITVQASDAAGNTSTSVVTVSAPKSQGK